MKRLHIFCAFLPCLVSCANNENPYDASGFFEATEITVSAEVSGRIDEFNITEGQLVTRDELLGSIDSIQLVLAKAQLESNIEALRSSIPDIEKETASLREQLKKQEYERTRVENLFKSNAATRKQLDDINSAISILETEIGTAEYKLESAIASSNAQISALEAQLAQTEDRIARCRILAPH